MSKKRFLLVDFDSWNSFPNLALMKISAYLKEEHKGAQIDLIHGPVDTRPLIRYDKAYLSCIYYQNEARAREYIKQLYPMPVEFGGSGFGTSYLKEYIEHIKPDYSLYDLDYGLGFTSRGCIRNCGFCIVPQKEGPIHSVSHVSDFLEEGQNKVVLLDNNFLASPEWKTNIEYLIENKIKVNFNQGLDIRLVNEENSKLLSECKYYNWRFTTRGLHFAFDDLRYMWEMLDGIQMLLDAGIRNSHLMFYVLIGYNSSFNEDRFRAELIKSFGAKPYIMTYDQHESKWSRNLERYYNGRYHEFIKFEHYNKGILCEQLQPNALFTGT